MLVILFSFPSFCSFASVVVKAGYIGLLSSTILNEVDSAFSYVGYFILVSTLFTQFASVVVKAPNFANRLESFAGCIFLNQGQSRSQSLIGRENE